MKYSTLQRAIAYCPVVFDADHFNKAIPPEPDWTIKTVDNGVSLTEDFMGPLGIMSRLRIIVTQKPGSPEVQACYYLYPEAIYDPTKPVPLCSFLAHIFIE